MYLIIIYIYYLFNILFIIYVYFKLYKKHLYLQVFYGFSSLKYRVYMYMHMYVQP